MQLVKAIVHQARRSEPDPAVAFAGGIATFGVLMGQTAAAVGALQALGVPKGSFVILDVRNPVNHLALIYALALLGIRSASVSAVFSTQLSGPRPDIFLTDRDDAVETGVRQIRLDSRWFAFEAGQPVDYGRLLALPGFLDREEVFRYVYSSGTTGRPKCVALTVASMEARTAHIMLTLSRRSSAGAEINLMGFSTTLGIMAPFFTHTVGALLCYPASPAETLQMIRLFNVSSVNGAVVQIQALVSVLGAAPPPSSLKSVGIAAAKVPLPLLKEVRARLCSHVISAYGSTELGALSFGTAADLERGDGATGYLLPWVEMEIVDEERRPVPRGTEGIIRARSDELAFYVDEDGSPSEMLEGGWFYPGDYGRIDPDGLIVVSGRTGEIINRGGVVIAPEFVEEVLSAEPGVDAAAAFGVPTDQGIDDIWAAVVASSQLDLDRLRESLAKKLVERAPSRIFQVDVLPRAESGKLMRNRLREQVIRSLSKPD